MNLKQPTYGTSYAHVQSILLKPVDIDSNDYLSRIGEYIDPTKLTEVQSRVSLDLESREGKEISYLDVLWIYLLIPMF